MRTQNQHTLTRQIARALMREDAAQTAQRETKSRRFWRDFLPEAQLRFARVQASAKARSRAVPA